MIVTVDHEGGGRGLGASMQTDSGRVDGAAQLANSPARSAALAMGQRLTSGALRSAPHRHRASPRRARCPTPGLRRSGRRQCCERLVLLRPGSRRPRAEHGESDRQVGCGDRPVRRCRAVGHARGRRHLWRGRHRLDEHRCRSPLTLAACAQSEAATVQLFPIAGRAGRSDPGRGVRPPRALRDQRHGTDGSTPAQSRFAGSRSRPPPTRHGQQ